MGNDYVCGQAAGHEKDHVPHLRMSDGEVYWEVRRLAEQASDLLKRWPNGLAPLGDQKIREQTRYWLERHAKVAL